MRMQLLCALLLAGGAAPAPAQSTAVIPVRPYPFAAIEGDTFLACPGRYAPSRAQFLFNASAMPQGPLLINAFRLRGDGGRSLAGGHAHTVQVMMSTPAAQPGRLPSLAWAANHGPGATVVVARLSVRYPALTGAAPEGFRIDVPLDRPFPWAGGAFVLDIATSGTALTSDPYYIDAQTFGGFIAPPPGRREYYGTAYPAGVGCRAEPVTPGGLLLFQGTTGIPSKGVPVAILLGASDKLAGPVALPHDLRPYGAKGCTLYTDPAVILAGAADPASPVGAFELRHGFLPLDSCLAGAVFFDQAFCLDPGYNAAGIGASQLARNTIGGLTFQGNYDCLYLYSYSTTGSHLWTGAEPVARFHAGKAPIVELVL